MVHMSDFESLNLNCIHSIRNFAMPLIYGAFGKLTFLLFIRKCFLENQRHLQKYRQYTLNKSSDRKLGPKNSAKSRAEKWGLWEHGCLGWRVPHLGIRSGQKEGPKNRAKSRPQKWGAWEMLGGGGCHTSESAVGKK